jgi:hypothetical protein
LAVELGRDARLELIRLSSGGASVLASRDLSPELLSDGSQKLAWSRSTDGTLRVTLNGARVIDVRDRAPAQGFDGITLTNRRGYFAVREVAVYGQ